MLQHVDNEQLVVKRSNWRGYGDPDKEQSNKETEGPPRRLTFCETEIKKHPSPQIKERRESQNQSENH
jgi:hypothetical protein